MDPRAAFERELASTALEVAARRLGAAIEAVRAGGGSQELLREWRRELERAAVRYCAACAHAPPD
jgi:hypothetical protein